MSDFDAEKAALVEHPTPSALVTELMPHQKIGLAWMMRKERAVEETLMDASELRS